ncbi:MAG: PHP domain-containing protein [Defluviitaleaceae bacterium]|nr:PHP domain-containing protein [Defluviitaleaceae bacterium]
MYLYETHMHTSMVSACAVCTPAEQVQAYKLRGYTGIIVTDHFVNGYTHSTKRMSWAEKMKFFMSGYERAKHEGDMHGLDVFLGWEYTIPGGMDFLTYGLDMDFLLAHPDVDKLPIKQYSTLVRENGGYLAQAHPFRRAYWINTPRPIGPNLIDGVEVFNSTTSYGDNLKAYDFALRHGLVMQAGSDAHDTEPPFASGIILREKAATIHDIIKALKSGQTELILPEDFDI